LYNNEIIVKYFNFGLNIKILLVFWLIFILSIIVLGIGLFFMSLQIILGRRKEFPDYRIGHNAELRKRKIYCPKTEQRIIDRQSSNDFCSSC